MGGLGNQMFQYSYARFLQETYGEELFFDTSEYQTYKVRNFSLSNLRLIDGIKDISEANLTKTEIKLLKVNQKIYRYGQRAYKKIFNTDQIGEKNFTKKSMKGLYYTFDRQYYPLVQTKKRIKSVYGYFPSDKYFNDLELVIKEELKVKTPLSDCAENILYDILSCNAVGVSIRWGKDYKDSNLNLCNEDYYYRGMDQVASEIENPTFYIFSDMIEDIKVQFNFKYPVKYVGNLQDYESLQLLYSCKHFVIANSSFSWWGAFLSSNQDKMIIAPSQWFIDSKKIPDIYNEKMTILDI